MTTSTLRREVLMPRLVPSMADGRIERWHVAEGQSVAVGDVLAEIATSSATMEIEAKAEGRVERILVPAGTAGIKVNTPIAILLDEAEGASSSGSMLGAANFLMASPALQALQAADELPTYREALRMRLPHEMRRDASVFVLGADVAQNRGAQKVTQGLLDEFGAARVVSAPPLDDAVFGLAIGAALKGFRPVVEISSWARAAEALEAVPRDGSFGSLRGGRGHFRSHRLSRTEWPGARGAWRRWTLHGVVAGANSRSQGGRSRHTGRGLPDCSRRRSATAGPLLCSSTAALYGVRGSIQAGAEADDLC